VWCAHDIALQAIRIPELLDGQQLPRELPGTHDVRARVEAGAEWSALQCGSGGVPLGCSAVHILAGGGEGAVLSVCVRCCLNCAMYATVDSASLLAVNMASHSSYQGASERGCWLCVSQLHRIAPPFGLHTSCLHLSAYMESTVCVSNC
jgi:hypothetical protein